MSAKRVKFDVDQIERAIKEAVNRAKTHGQNLNSKLITFRLVTNQPWTEKLIKDKWTQLYPKGDTNFKENKFSLEKIEKARLMAQKLTKIKWFKMVAVTGSVAMMSANKDDDIDILVITENNRLWLARAIGMFWLKVVGIDFRRAGEKVVADKFCFNMWLDQQNLEIISQKRSVGAALDLINMKVVTGDKTIFEKLLRKNDWIEAMATPGYRHWLRGTKEGGVVLKKNDLLGAINLVFYWVQRIYMRPKMTREIVSIKAAYFHPRLI